MHRALRPHIRSQTLATSYAIFPGSLNLVFLVAFLQAGGPTLANEAYLNFLRQCEVNMAIWAGTVPPPLA